MDDLLKEFLTESHEHLDTVDRQMVEFESNPSNSETLRNIFRLVHTIKGTCGFLGLPRLEALAHSAETLLGQLRDGAEVTSRAVTLTLASIDRIKVILAGLEDTGIEPEGSDADLIAELDKLTAAVLLKSAGSVSTLPDNEFSRPLKAGEASLDELERAFRETVGPDFGVGTADDQTDMTMSQSAQQDRHIDDPAESRLAAQSIRVQVGTLEHLMTMVSELVLTRNQLLEIARRENDQSFKLPLQRLSHITAELQDGVMKTRMQPIGHAWNKLPRVVRDLSAELGKKIELVMEGSDTELDRQVLEQIKDPLTHMVRNSADHGIETPTERLAAGKPEIGRIRLCAAHEGGSITIRVSDDGKGLDMARIRRKVLQDGIASSAELDKMTDAQVARFIFHAGLSTATTVTNVSGRGVGMDVVKSNITAIGGTVDISSEPGRGTTFSIKLPLTLAIVSALIVAVDDQRFAIPQSVVRELVRVRPGSGHVVEQINGASILRLRDRLLPVVTLSGVMRTGEGTVENGFVVVTQIGQQQFGLMVDGVLQTEEIVVKPMSAKLKAISLFSGNTILGDGAVVLILDPNGLARRVGNLEIEDDKVAADDQATDETRGVAQTVLVFQGGGGSLKAVPLSLVTRLEEIDGSCIEFTSGKPLVQYRGKLMPLVLANEALKLNREGLQPLVIFSDGARTMGLAVEAIVDIIEEHVDIEFAATDPGVIGSVVLGGRATEMIDLAHYLPQAYPDWLTGRAMPLARGPRNILLVEQSNFLREMLAPVIKAAGFNPVCCANAAEAIAQLAGPQSFDCIIVDIEHAGSDGLRIVELASRDSRHAQVPLIGMASIPHPALVEQCHAAGLRALVAKFDRQGLMDALRANPNVLSEAA
ncbi:MAG: chemotaxis protein CheW [Bosea sp. (in: a-proteobacteria)]